MPHELTYVGTNPRDTGDLLMQLYNPPPVIGVDTETISIEDKTMIGLCIATNHTDSFWFQNGSPHLDIAMNILRNPNITKVWWNSKFDYDVLMPYKIDEGNFEDAEILSYNRNKPNKLYKACEYLNIHIPEQYANWSMPEGQDMSQQPIDFVRGKCGVDSRVTLWAWDRMKADIPDSYYIDRNIVHILRRMEMKGVKVNQDMLGEFYDQVKEEVSWYRSLITLKFGCDPGSNQQVGITLAKRGHRLPYTKTHKQFKVDEAILRDLDDPLAQTILLFREKSKLLSTYIEPLLGLERVHTRFNNTRVVTGRLSSSNPNMQNIPEYFRPCFEADDIWFDLDASQIELRVVAWLSQDRVLMDAFRNGEDIHRRTMLEMGLTPSPENRKLAKTINFAVLYGAEYFTVVETAKKEGIHLSLRDASGLIQQYFARMSGVKDWVDAMKSQVKATGMVRTMYGRERHVSQEILNDPGKLEKALREMINMPVQGTAAEIIKKCMARASGYDLRLQVHDSLAYNGACPPPSRFENVAPFAIPMKLVVGKEWGMGDVIPYN